MGHITLKSRYAAPIERVYALAVDPVRIPEYMPWVVEVFDVVGQPGTVGSGFRFREKTLGRFFEARTEVIAAEKPRHYAARTTYDNGATVHWEMRFQPSDGEVEGISEIDYELPAGVFGQIADRLFLEQAMARRLRHADEDFKALVEAEVRELTPA